jgi:hypothetical protein
LPVLICESDTLSLLDADSHAHGVCTTPHAIATHCAPEAVKPPLSVSRAVESDVELKDFRWMGSLKFG